MPDREDIMKKFYSGFDILRTLFCALIVIHHFFSIMGWNLIGPDSALWPLVLHGGVMGVSFFFVLSGFCLASGYRKRIPAGEVRFFDFFKKHYIRFFVFSAITLLPTVLKQYLVWKAGMDEMPTWRNILLDLFCIRTGYGFDYAFPYNSALWYIDILLQMYIVYFVFAFFLGNFSRIVTVLASALLSGAGLFIVLREGTEFWGTINVNGRGLYCFFAGVLLAEIFTWLEEHPRLKKVFVAIAIGAMIWTVCMIRTPLMTARFNEIFTYSLWLPLIYVMTFADISKVPYIGRFFHYTGKLSNSVYIWHHPIIYIVYPLASLGKISVDWNSIPFTIGMMILILAVSVFSMEVLEKYLFGRIFAEKKAAAD